MSKEEKTKEDAYYVGLGDASVTRRAVLEAARAVVQTVSQHSKIRDIQEQKLRLRTDLVHTVRMIREGLHKLEAAIPQPHGPVPEVAAPIVIRKRVVNDHRLDKIESALSEIEQRMRSL